MATARHSLSRLVQRLQGKARPQIERRPLVPQVRVLSLSCIHLIVSVKAAAYSRKIPTMYYASVVRSGAVEITLHTVVDQTGIRDIQHMPVLCNTGWLVSFQQHACTQHATKEKETTLFVSTILLEATHDDCPKLHGCMPCSRKRVTAQNCSQEGGRGKEEAD